MKKVLQRIPVEVSIHWRYLHQDGRKTWLEISKMKSYRKRSKATICRHMVKKIDDLVLDKWKQNPRRPTKLSDRQKRNILRQDGDPSQNSCKARFAWDKIGAGKFSILFQHIVLI